MTTSQDLQGCEADESNLEALRECDAAPKLHYASKCVPQPPRVKNYRERGCSCADGVARCRFCPFRKKCRDPEVAKEALRKHFAKCHPGERANPVKRRESCVRRLADEDSVHWKCKWCDMGITAADAERFGEATLIRFRNDHKTAAHPRLSWAKWNHDTRRQGDLVSWTRKISVTKRNAYVAKTLPVVRELEGRDFVTFLWPRLAGKDTSKVDRYPLRFKLAWRCTRCHAPFQHDKLAREHRDKAAACPSLNAVRCVCKPLRSTVSFTTRLPPVQKSSRERVSLLPQEISCELPCRQCDPPILFECSQARHFLRGSPGGLSPGRLLAGSCSFGGGRA